MTYKGAKHQATYEMPEVAGRNQEWKDPGAPLNLERPVVISHKEPQVAMTMGYKHGFSNRYRGYIFGFEHLSVWDIRKDCISNKFLEKL